MSWTEEDRKVGLSGGVWQEVQMLEIELETLSRQNKWKELQIHNFQNRLGQQIVKDKEVCEELQSLQQDAQRLHNESKTAETSREHLSKTLKSTQAQVCCLEAQLDAAHSLNKKLNEEVKRLEAENEKLQNQQHLDFYDVASASSNKKTPRRHQSDQSHTFCPWAVFPEERDDSMSAAIWRIETDNILQQREQETRDPLIDQLKQMIDSFQSSIDQLANNIPVNIYRQMQMMKDDLQESILSDVQGIVKREVSMALKEQRTVTHGPSKHLDYKAEKANILQLLQRGQINQAFQQALSATDLDLDLFVCETSYSYRVFQLRPCPLSQPVLLSLIQHLSSNLATFSELRISYLEEAVLNLDDDDPLMRDDISDVLSQVKPQLSAFLQRDPNGPLSTRVELLLKLLSL